jgi:hypothetical protein
VVDVDRRTCLTAVGAAGASALAGCISGSTEDRGELEPERPASGTADECVEETLFEKSVFLMGRALSVLLGSASLEWQIDLQSGEELEVYLGKPDPRADYRIPGVAIVDPDGRALVEKRRPPSNDHAVTAETDGTYTVRVRNRYLTENHRNVVAITWYGSTGCTG